MKDSDPAQLTDGKRVGSKGMLWTQRGGITWSYANPVTITVDLGKVQPISGAGFSTAANIPSGIHWPESIRVAVSIDQKQWYYLGDLAKLSPPPDKGNGYTTYTYKTATWKTKGRYVAFGVSQKLFTVTDEVGVFGGPDAWLNEPVKGMPISSMKDLAKRQITTQHAKERIAKDIHSVRDAMQKAFIAQTRKKVLLQQLEKISAGLPQMPLLPAHFRSIFPFNKIHGEVFAVYGKLLAMQGFSPLTIWQQPRYEWLPLLATPKTTPAELHFLLLGNQHRSDAILLTNATAEPMPVTLAVNNPPSGARAGWLTVSQVEFTDTRQGVAVADALLPAATNGGDDYTITVEPGMTRKVWLTVNSSRVPPGQYKSHVIIKTAHTEHSIPLSLEVADIAMPEPRLSLTTWDYAATAGGNPDVVTKQNRRKIIDMMRASYVDTAWSNEWGVHFASLVTAKDFDANNNLIHPDFSRIAQWHQNWPDAQRYIVFLGSVESKPAFAGAKMGSPDFKERLSSWARALVDYLPAIGIKPSQFAVCIVDESHTAENDEVIAGWAKVLKTAAPQLQIFSDPQWHTPQHNKNQAAMKLPDMICVKPGVYINGSEETRQYFDALKNKGTQLWFYSCSGPVRVFAPQYYFRYQAWLAFAAGAKGQGFWSFTDTSKALSSWNEYGTSRPNFAPAFIDKDTVNSSLHWEAIRDGMQDNEELGMLRDAISKCKNPTLKSRAQGVLKNALKAVVDDWKTVSGITKTDAARLPQYSSGFESYRQPRVLDWRLNHHFTLADQQAAKVRRMLIEVYRHMKE